MNGKKVFTTGQVAAVCKVAPRTVAKWFDSGRLKGYRIPGSNDRRIPRESLLAFLKEHGMPTDELEAALDYKVVLVGADLHTAGRLRDLLPAADGFRIDAAASVFVAGALVASARPEAVVIDLGVGRSDGLAIAASLRREASLAGLALAALASEDETDPDGLTAGGFDRSWKKPFDLRELAGWLSDLAADRANGTQGRPLYTARKELAPKPPLQLARPSV